ncbi:17044_t:CDS:2, partial [Cetraspora pellucida]
PHCEDEMRRFYPEFLERFKYSGCKAASNHTNKCELKEDRISLNEEEYGSKNECELEEDEISSNEEEYSTKSKVWTGQFVGQNYDTKKDILNIAQKNAKNFGFAVSTKSSSFHHLYIQCKRGGQSKNCWDLTIDKRKRKKMSKRCECPYLIKAIPNNSKWCVAEIINEHNHPMVKEAIRSEDGTPTATRKDISNLSTRINFLEKTASMAALINAKSEKSYVWIIEHLASLIFSDIFPSVFVTDNDLALIGALGKVIDNFIYSRDCDALNAVITTYKKLALSSSNESEVLKYLD